MKIIKGILLTVLATFLLTSCASKVEFENTYAGGEDIDALLAQVFLDPLDNLYVVDDPELCPEDTVAASLGEYLGQEAILGIRTKATFMAEFPDQTKKYEEGVVNRMALALDMAGDEVGIMAMLAKDMDLKTKNVYKNIIFDARTIISDPSYDSGTVIMNKTKQVAVLSDKKAEGEGTLYACLAVSGDEATIPCSSKSVASIKGALYDVESGLNCSLALEALTALRASGCIDLEIWEKAYSKYCSESSSCSLYESEFKAALNLKAPDCAAAAAAMSSAGKAGCDVSKMEEDYEARCAPPVITYSVGDPGPSGGFIFFVDDPVKKLLPGGITYLEAAPSDTSVLWALNDGQTTGAISPVTGAGSDNTQQIISYLGENYNDGNYAAKVCVDLSIGGFDDWFLPSKDELNTMYKNLYLSGLGGFATNAYWSSSENSDITAWYQDFNDGSQNINSKGSHFSVRCARMF